MQRKMAARYQKRLCTGLIVRNCDLDHVLIMAV
ncbi:hypothetical protein VPHD260_0208 [Vibrio phage D260]